MILFQTSSLHRIYLSCTNLIEYSIAFDVLQVMKRELIVYLVFFSDDFPETTGVKRIVQSLHAHMWPNLEMKGSNALICEEWINYNDSNIIEPCPQASFVFLQNKNGQKLFLPPSILIISRQTTVKHFSLSLKVIFTT